MTDELLLHAAFEHIMQPVCERGWRVHFDYQPTRASSIRAGHANQPYQTYHKVVFSHQEVVPVYERWFTSCAALLLRLTLDAAPDAAS